MLENCEQELKKLLVDLKKRAEGNRLGWERLKGAFLAPHTREAVNDLHQRCQNLNSVFSFDETNLQVTANKKAREDRKKRQGQKMLVWLSHRMFHDQQKDNLARRHPGTGEWLFELETFQKWRDGDAEVQPMLTRMREEMHSLHCIGRSIEASSR